MIDFIGYIFLIFGVAAFLVSAFGLFRMPDFYTRIHIGTKTTTIGVLLIILGSITMEPTWILKLSLIVIFIFLTNPLSSSVIARASHNNGNHLNKDELKEII